MQLTGNRARKGRQSGSGLQLKNLNADLSIRKTLEKIRQVNNSLFPVKGNKNQNLSSVDELMTAVEQLVAKIEIQNKSHRYLKDIFSSVNEMIIVTDTSRRIVMANKKACEKLKYSENEFNGMTIDKIINDNVFNNLRGVSVNENRKGAYKLDVMLTASGGQVIPVVLDMVPLNDNDGGGQNNGVVCIAKTVSDRNIETSILTLHDKIIRHTIEGICLISENTGKVIYTNDRLDEMFGYQPGQISQSNDFIPFPAFHNEPGTAGIAQIIHENGFWSGEALYYKKDGSQLWCKSSISTFEHVDYGTVWLIMHTDLSEQKLLEEKLTRLSLIDPLTNVRNRRSLDEQLEREWNRGARTFSPLSVLMIDVDRFKEFNDLYGHQAGDECLKKVSRILEKAAKRSGDFIARYGGEEFCAVLPQTDEKEAQHVANEIQKLMKQLKIRHAASATGYLTISIGVRSVVPLPKGNFEKILNDADKALYQAKKNGRNQVVNFIEESA